MAVRVLIGNLLESKAQVLVNTVNCVGIMGKGIALDFKTEFPEYYRDYAARCSRGEVRLGRPYIYMRITPPHILSFPTKDHWRSVTRLSDIHEGLAYFASHYRKWGITSIAFPPLGCGNGQLEWRIVGPTLYRALEQLPELEVELYAPHGTPHNELRPEFLGTNQPKLQAFDMPDPQWIKPPMVALVEIVRRIEAARYHCPVGRITFQKIAYVATREGIPTGIVFGRGSYGPHSPTTKLMTTRLLNNGLIHEGRRGQMFRISPGSTFADATRVYSNELQKWEVSIVRVANLFQRLTPRQAEVVATIMFVADELRGRDGRQPTENEIYESVIEWKRSNPNFPQSEVANTIRSLAVEGWIDVKGDWTLPVGDYPSAPVQTP